jgi:hypothetical protein
LMGLAETLHGEDVLRCHSFGIRRRASAIRHQKEPSGKPAFYLIPNARRVMPGA